jgi:uncharacterized damage-inducible protein DinB
MKEYLRFLYAYNHWANRRVLDACVPLTQDEFLRGKGSSTPNPSVRDTLVHTMGAQEIWLARWGGVSPTRVLDPEDFGTLALVHQYWDLVEQHTQAFLSAAEENILLDTMRYTNTRGEPFAYPRWMTMVHQVNHATQHRSEVAHLLTQMNHSPGNLDILIYMDEIIGN